MVSEAYLSSTFIFPNGRITQDANLIRTCLIAYDKLYIDQDLTSVPWSLAKSTKLLTDYRNEKDDKLAKKLLKQLMKLRNKNEDDTNLSGLNFANYLDGDYRIFRMLSNSILNIREHQSPSIRNFFRESFEYPMEIGGSGIFHSFIFPLLDNFFSDELHINWHDTFEVEFLIVLIQELFVTAFLTKKHNIVSVLSLNDIEIRNALSKIRPIPLGVNEALEVLRPSGIPTITIKKPRSDYSAVLFQDEKGIHVELANPYNPLQKYFGRSKSIQNAVNISTRVKKQKDVKLLLEFSVPEFSKIPIVEIAKLKQKDKLKSIGQLTEQIRDGNQRMSNLDFSKKFIEYLWEIGKTLSPSVPETLVGILGEVPLPIPINPLGLLSSANDINQLIQFKKKYSWFITLSKLQKL